jgi:hypothetical protein
MTRPAPLPDDFTVEHCAACGWRRLVAPGWPREEPPRCRRCGAAVTVRRWGEPETKPPAAAEPASQRTEAP